MLNQLIFELPPDHPVSDTRPLRDSLGHTPIQVGPASAIFQGNSNGGRRFLSNRRSNRHIVPLHGKSDRLFTRVFRLEKR